MKWHCTRCETERSFWSNSFFELVNFSAAGGLTKCSSAAFPLVELTKWNCRIERIFWIFRRHKSVNLCLLFSIAKPLPMNLEILLRYVHFISIFAIVGSLVSEHLLLKKTMTR